MSKSLRDVLVFTWKMEAPNIDNNHGTLNSNNLQIFVLAEFCSDFLWETYCKTNLSHDGQSLMTVCFARRNLSQREHVGESVASADVRDETSMRLLAGSIRQGC